MFKGPMIRELAVGQGKFSFVRVCVNLSGNNSNDNVPKTRKHGREKRRWGAGSAGDAMQGMCRIMVSIGISLKIVVKRHFRRPPPLKLIYSGNRGDSR